MDTLNFKRPARAEAIRPALVGYVGSGDLEVMIEPSSAGCADIHIHTSTDGSEARWRQVIELIESVMKLPVMRMDIHDFAATPGVIRLRIEQALELAREDAA
ncbi:malonate decarboxylase acyl carrier protein [Marinobacterium nitratireducens]|uniref:Malonate decarboxylase acyl carrier protein n=1 Tax=Marinobacterium nitratireducens TaxID=518897 RepID=A0A918DVS2_9GAMM|nr:malonate decarboxylase acyl carrier protein [Marinobacterium nitratireducens]GGO86450.1 malonate decarboxylase acyl carrier protein [Marinobacterium nitratireducens]